MAETLGPLRVPDVEAVQVAAALKPIWGTETGSRTRGRLETVFHFAIARNWRPAGTNPAMASVLKHLLPKPPRKEPQHYPAMPHQDVPAFITLLRTRDGMTARALQFQIFTASRTGEVLWATWEEINLKAGRWTIPAHRMKMKEPHMVPLTAPVVELLEALPRNGPYVFQNEKGKPFSNQVLIMLMRRAGYGQFVPHGFRSSFRDWAAEVAKADRQTAEAALAHRIASGTEAAYLRSKLFDARKGLMSEWAQYCLAVEKPGANHCFGLAAAS
ncbi:MAG: site-specific integrase [Rhizobiales bacterium]|nr:site-specific integrase [Hyphomicrobiales bacterium]